MLFSISSRYVWFKLIQCIQSVNQAFIGLFVCSFICSFGYSLIRSFLHSCVSAFRPLFVLEFHSACKWVLWCFLCCQWWLPVSAVLAAWPIWPNQGVRYQHHEYYQFVRVDLPVHVPCLAECAKGKGSLFGKGQEWMSQKCGQVDAGRPTLAVPT